MTNPLTTLPMRAARWSATHPWRAIAAWLALVGVAVGLALLVSTRSTTDADYRLGESGRADAWVAEAGLDSPDTESVLIQARTGADGDLDASTAERAAARLRVDLFDVSGVATVSEPQWSPDRSALLVSVALARDQEDAAAVVTATEAVASDFPELRIRQAGDLTLGDGIDEQVEADLSRAEGISLPVTLVLMLLAFGALIAAGIPVLLAATSVAATLGLSAPLSHLVPAEPTVSSMIVLIGMAVGVDYSLFYLKRERAERAAGRTTLDAVAIAAETSGHAILVSGGAVIASLAGLYLVGDATFNSLATGAIVVVAVAVVGSITVLPALLARLGRWVDRPRVPLLWRFQRRLSARLGERGLSARILAPVVRRPLLAMAAGTVVLGALAVPALGMKLESASLKTLPTSIPEVVTLTDLTRAFPSEGTTADLVVTAEPEARDTVATALEQVRRDAPATGLFAESTEAITVSDDGRTSVLTLAIPFEESDDRVDRAVDRLRDDVAPRAFAGVADAAASGVDWAVGGDSAESTDYVRHQREGLPLVIGFVLLLTLGMMAATFRSLPIAVVSTLLNLLSVGVAFGVVTLTFQHGWGESLLDFSSPGYVIEWIPLFVLVVLVGLSMDYHVFVLSRVRELVRTGVPARQAVERGVADTAGVVTSAAAVMVSVFAIFAAMSMLEMKMMGVGLAFAILVDATLVRLVLLPAALVLLGERAWPARRGGRPAPERAAERPLAEVQ